MGISPSTVRQPELKLVRTSAHLSQGQLERLNRLSRRRDRSVAYLIREAVDRYLGIEQEDADDRRSSSRNVGT